jgi:hypothetical protein
MAGGVVSSTVTTKVQVLVLEALSDAAQFTVVAPSGNIQPEGGLQTTAGLGSHTSEAVELNSTTVPPMPVHSTVRLVEHVSAGPVESWTVTINEHVFVFPEASETEQVTVVAPTLKVDPDGGVHVVVGLPSQRSLAITSNCTNAPVAPVHSSVRLVEHVMDGALVSVTMTFRRQTAGALTPSEAATSRALVPTLKSWTSVTGVTVRLPVAGTKSVCTTVPFTLQVTVRLWEVRWLFHPPTQQKYSHSY